jgi:hypothetical protein
MFIKFSTSKHLIFNSKADDFKSVLKNAKNVLKNYVLKAQKSRFSKL